MKIIKTEHPEVLQIQPEIHKDQRGFFLETFQKDKFLQVGITGDFVQDNYSSSIKSTLRGLHYQVTHIQGKLVLAVRGEIFDVAVDLRRNSPYFGKWTGVILSEVNKNLLWVPPGFAHGFYNLSERADVFYKTTNYYDPTGERCLKWDDPDLGINWPVPPGKEPILSKKDAEGTLFHDAEVF